MLAVNPFPPLPPARSFSLDYIYCWHGLPAYWAGVMPGASELEPMSATIMYAEPTPGVLEVEPSMAWNPAVLAGGCRGGVLEGRLF